MPPAPRDPEITALETLIGVLEPLDDQARARVLDYAMRRLQMRELPPLERVTLPSASEADEPLPQTPVTPAQQPTDIRTLKEQKAPATAIEMAALVAYYLQELAPEEDRKQAIVTADVDRLFKQAVFPLPNRIGNTLPNAAAAGYFDTTGTRGEYKLNPVGFNLVTQTLPRASGGSARPTTRRRTAGAKKKTAARKKATSARKKGSAGRTASTKAATKRSG